MENIESLIDYLDYGVKNGFMTINEARLKLNLKQIDEKQLEELNK